MRQIVLGLTLAAMGGCALAEWVEVSSAVDGKVTYYADPATMDKIGTTVKVLTLMDYQEAQVISANQKYLSVKLQEEVNCADQKARHLNLTALTEHMGAGKIVGSEKNPAEWRPAATNTIFDGILKFVCEQK